MLDVGRLSVTREMSTHRFWSLIDQARRDADGDVDEYGLALEGVLAHLTPDELIEFERHFDSLIDAAWRWDLWGAAYILNGGCSDDGFLYFRGWLVMQGQRVYEASLADPDSLADSFVGTGIDYECEDVLYVARSLYETRAGQEMPLRGNGGAPTPAPQGRQWTEDDLLSLLPRLASLS